MFTITNNEDEVTLKTILPKGTNQGELVKITESEIDELIDSGIFYGKRVKITGRITTAMCLLLGHKLAHVCLEVQIFDPRQNEFLVVIQH